MRYSIILLLVLSLSGCSESEVALDTDRLGFHYFPLEVGSYRIYDVEENIYSVLGVDSKVYELKESVVDSNLNAGNNLQYIIHRSTRLNESEKWTLDSIWTAQKTTNIAVLTENNVPFVKLSFPVVHKLEWDGNRLNSLNSEIYWYNMELPDTTIMDSLYQDIVQVVQNDRGEDFLGLENRSEIFAPNVGMIIKESVILKYCQTDCNEEKEIESGREIVMTIKAYGKE